jgi:hypothetical protein
MGRRETEHEGGKKQAKGKPAAFVLPCTQVGCACSRGLQASAWEREGALRAGSFPRAANLLVPEPRLSPSPGVGRSGVRRPASRLIPSPGVGRSGVHRLSEPRLSLSPGVGRGGVRRLSKPRLSPSPGVGRGGVHHLPEPRLSPSSSVEVEPKPSGRARRSFLWRPRLDLAAVSLTLLSGTAVGAMQATLFSCQVGQWSGKVTAVTSALSTEERTSG